MFTFEDSSVDYIGLGCVAYGDGGNWESLSIMWIMNERHSGADFSPSHTDQVLVDVRQDFFPQLMFARQIYGTSENIF